MIDMDVWLSLGGNGVSTLAAIEKAVALLGSTLSEFVVATPYKTRPVGGLGPDYTNTVAHGNHHGTLEELNTICKDIEVQLGRRHDLVDSAGAKIVEIDIDVVVADGAILRSKDYVRDYFMRGYRNLGGHACVFENGDMVSV